MPSNFANLMVPQKNRLNSLERGTPLSQFYPFNSNNMLESFRMHQSRPGFESTLPNSELSANYTHPVTRVVKPYTDAVDAVSVLEIALEYNDDPHNMETIRTTAGFMQSNPQTVVAPAVWNLMVYNQQVYDAQRDYEDYLTRTPSDYWAKWSVAGVVEFEEMLDGSESTQTSGLKSGHNMQHSGGYKLVTITSKGPAFMYNVFGSNILSGGKCYALIKKHTASNSFNLSSKSCQAQALGLNSVHIAPHIDTPMLGNTGNAIQPYQMSLVCMPSGGILPPEATMYYDEMGELRYDGLAIYLGKIFSTPIDHVYKPLNNYYDIKPMTQRQPSVAGSDYVAKYDAAPFTDAQQQSVGQDEIMYMKLMIDCNDGLSPF